MRMAKLEPNLIQLQRWDQRVRERRAVGAGPDAAQRDAGGEGVPQLSYCAGLSACEKGKQWQRALALLSEMRDARVEPVVMSYSAGIRSCGKGEQWERALSLLSEMWEAKFELDDVSCQAGISACSNGGQWQRALSLQKKMSEAKMVPEPYSPTTLWQARARRAISGSGLSLCSARCCRRSWNPAYQLQRWDQRVHRG
ncbi:unnamed protein product [Prorocentrum cordatum]|uniref:Pentatricopeptide repeat-containing protein, chloroplastic n=1 Tax=Prorocentrum cordatum TaxID=2364126 RepID=A0ABN9VJ20_9DINO|nr:unnamed protein product [Polarella glacialis]